MKRAALLMVMGALSPSQAIGQSAAPHKLVIFRSGGGIAVTDYPSLSRCEAGRRALLALIERENASRGPKALPGGGVIVPNRLSAEAYCIPS